MNGKDGEELTKIIKEVIVSKKFKLLGILLVISVLAVPLVGCARGLTLTVSGPKDGATLTESPVSVHGSVSDPEATITVNGLEVEVVEVASSVSPVRLYGAFSAVVELTEGENTITVVATLGEETVTKTVTVTYKQYIAMEERGRFLNHLPGVIRL